ncbi:MAG: hypothetical protein JPMHGGIA_00414 [Saprospiraceae bacterium]|nr:hypothetical protein [Saprospiraceae bacterium]
MDTAELKGKRLVFLIGANLALTMLIGWGLTHKLQKTEADYIRSSSEASSNQPSDENPGNPGQNRVGVDTPQMNGLVDTPKGDRAKQTELNRPNEKDTAKAGKQKSKGTPAGAEVKSGVTFYDIILLMILAGSLGGLLCNLRGFFMHFQSEQRSFPGNLEIPYYVRILLGGGAGLFIYFVANFMISSVTMEYRATQVPFNGMVSFIALAILAGFGSLEFFQRLKETARALFGQKAEKSKWERIEELYGLHKKGVISEDEFKKLKDDLIAASDIETRMNMLERLAQKKSDSESSGP